MLKIKDNVDLKELEKFGFYDSIQAIYPRKYLKIIDNSHLIEIEYDQVDKISIKIIIVNIKKPIWNGDKTKILYYEYISGRYGDDVVSKYIQDLIKADLVEKVEE